MRGWGEPNMGNPGTCQIANRVPKRIVPSPLLIARLPIKPLYPQNKKEAIVECSSCTHNSLRTWNSNVGAAIDVVRNKEKAIDRPTNEKNLRELMVSHFLFTIKPSSKVYYRYENLLSLQSKYDQNPSFTSTSYGNFVSRL